MDCEEPSLFEVGPDPDDRGCRLLAPASAALPALRHEATFVEPVRRLNETLSDVLDVEAHPQRTPEESLSLLKSAMDTFNDESEDWF